MKSALRYLALAALTVSLAGPARAARGYSSKHVFTTVDAFDVEPNMFTVTGIRRGEAAPTSVEVAAYPSSGSTTEVIDSCRALALAAMAKPGAFLFEVHWNTDGYPGCVLTRVNP